MKLDSETEEKIAQTAFCWLDYDYYGSEEKAIKAFRRRKGMSKFDTETVRAWLSVAVEVRKRLDIIKAEIVKSYRKSSHHNLTEDQYADGTKILTLRLNEEYPELKATVSYMISMAWCMYYLR